MAGGTWTEQNKVRPGVYINYSSSPSALASMGDRGVVCIAKELDWCEQGNFITIEDPSECFDKLGYDQMSDKLIWLRQILLGTNRSSGASKVLVWRLETTSSAAATASQMDSQSSSSITATAVYKGIRGNDISVVVTADPDNSSTSSKFYVQTLVSGDVVDSQTLSADDDTVPFTGLVDNKWVKFNTQGNAFATSLTLANGANGSLSTTAYSKFLAAAELETWNVLAYGGTDAVLKSAVASYVKRLSNDEGKKVCACLWNYPEADFETTISVYPQKITDVTGHELTEIEMVCWVAGATAGASPSQSLTYSNHPDAKSVSPVLTSSQQVNAIEKGQFAFIEEFDRIKVLQDNNTFTSFTATKGKAFRKNRVIRTIFGLSNDTYKVFSQSYIGNTNNDEFGRDLLKAEILNLMYQYQNSGALQNVIADDVVVTKGVESDGVVIEINCQPVDSIEKIYINITIS